MTVDLIVTACSFLLLILAFMNALGGIWLVQEGKRKPTGYLVSLGLTALTVVVCGRALGWW